MLGSCMMYKLLGHVVRRAMQNRRPVQALALRAALAVLAFSQFGPTRADSPPTDGQLVEQIPKLLEQYSRQGDFQLPSLSITELDTLAAGETIVAVFRDPTVTPTEQADTQRLVGWQVVNAPRLLVWLSILGGNEEPSARLNQAVLLQRTAGAYISYHLMDLPWPFKDRQWTLLCEQNLGLAERSHDAIWEHRWSLLPRDDALLESAYKRGLMPGLTHRALDESVYLRANRGAWILFDLGASRTLVAASMDIDFGGHIPDAIARSFGKHQLRTFLESLSALRGRHYTEMPVVHDGRGLPITREAAMVAARFQRDPPRLTKASAVTER
jgi:hypothetical protein